MTHDSPWLVISTLEKVGKRKQDIKRHKPKHEQPLRLHLMRIVKEPLPPRLQKAYAAYVKARAAYVKAYAAYVKGRAALEKADVAREKADVAWWKATNSDEGVAFHKKVCGCAWTPEQPDILQETERAKIPTTP